MIPEHPSLDRRRATILVADDDHAVQIIARMALERAGHRVLIATDGPEAIDLFRAAGGAVDLVVLDLSMPRMSGRQTFDELAAIDPAVRVVISSGFSRNDAGAGFEDLPIAGWLQKPFRADALVSACEGALDHP